LEKTRWILCGAFFEIEASDRHSLEPVCQLRVVDILQNTTFEQLHKNKEEGLVHAIVLTIKPRFDAMFS
jgi:hypothetical protein